MSHITCHMSGVTCQVSHVRCNFFFLFQIGEASRWRVCYQRGLPRLILYSRNIKTVAYVSLQTIILFLLISLHVFFPSCCVTQPCLVRCEGIYVISAADILWAFTVNYCHLLTCSHQHRSKCWNSYLNLLSQFFGLWDFSFYEFVACWPCLLSWCIWVSDVLLWLD